MVSVFWIISFFYADEAVVNCHIFQAEVEETLKRIQSQKGVQGIIVANAEGSFPLLFVYLD